jgi:protein TonB
MKHWPSFEPSGEAGESGRFLALWPSIIPNEPEEKANPKVPVELERTAEKPSQSSVPPGVDPIGETTRPAGVRATRFSPLLLLLSLVVHAATIVLAAHFLTQSGVNAETDAISVEIVVDATPSPSTDPSLAGETAAEAKPQDRAEPAASPVEKQQETEKPAADVTPPARTEDHAVVVPPPALTLPSTPPDIEGPHANAPAVATAIEMPPPTLSLPPTPPAVEAPEVLATPLAVEARVPIPALVLPEAPPKVEVLRPAPMTLEMVTQAVPAPSLKLADAPPPIVDNVEPPLALPDEAPVPTQAPDKTPSAAKAETTVPKEGAKAVPPRQQAKPAPARKPDKHPARHAPSEDHRMADRNSSAGVGNAAGRGSVASRGGASAGEKAAYAARLNSHVQRFERYPAEAERNGVTGSARLVITIDRGGRLISSRLAASSGSAVLDDAARATASRASPYPPPPDGIGGRTLTFAATIRFRR